MWGKRQDAFNASCFQVGEAGSDGLSPVSACLHVQKGSCVIEFYLLTIFRDRFF